MKKLVLTALAVTLIAGTAGAADNVANVKVEKNNMHVKATSPAASTTANAITVNSNVAGGVHNVNKGFYAMNNTSIGSVTSRLKVESAAVHIPRIRSGKGDINFTFAEALAVGANVSVENSDVRREEISPLEVFVPILIGGSLGSGEE